MELTRRADPIAYLPSFVRALLLVPLVLIGCAESDEEPDDPALGVARAGAASPTTPSGEVVTEDDGQWTMAAKSWASTRFSGLDEIDTANVAELQLAWTFSTGTLRGHEAAPLVIGDRMFITTPYPNKLYALDTEDGALVWEYDPGTVPAAQGVACCDVVNRGAAYADGRLFYNTLDVHTVAVDAETGEAIWKVRLGDINLGESMTMAPIVAEGMVFVGNSGGEFGVRGWITALDQASGEIVWRAYSTGPDSEVLIDPETFRPYYEADREPDLGVSTWPPDQWRLGGGNVWGWISYDPELRLLYHGTGNPGVWNPAMREGDNKWTAALFARDVETGRARWAYQFTPHDEHDYDAIMENVLLDLEWEGEARKILLRPERNGFMYVIDRETGEVLAADPWGPVNWATHVDLETGRPVKDAEKATGDRLARNVCPAAPGMKDWQPSSWSPRTGLLYIPHNHLCMDYEGIEANYIAGTPYVGADVRMYSAGGGHRGMFSAWNPIERGKAWEIPERFPVWSGALATAGDVVFYGTMDRWFKAVDARTGELLWRFRAGSGIIGQPVTYLGPDGRQYVAVLSGVGGWAGAAALGILPEEDPGIALGFATAMADLPNYTAEGGMLYVFALPRR
jgi:lanthanide-dependent methanol dehydrogenase